MLAVGLAGCITGDTDTTSQSDFGLSDDRGRLVGRVIDSELRPVAGANITFEGVDDLRAVTGASGGFNVSLPPGTYELLIEAPGFFRDRQDVTIRAGDVSELHVTLQELPSQVPYLSVYPLAGYSVCDISLFLWVTTYDGVTGQDCPLGDPVRTAIQEIAESWRYAVVEMTWETADSFALYVADDQNCLTSDPCYAIIFAGSSPARVDLAPNDPELAAQWASDGEAQPPEGAWEMWANVIYIGMYQDQWGGLTSDPICRGLLNYSPGCPSWGVSTGIPFTTYVSVFNWERPADPNAYTALPDE